MERLVSTFCRISFEFQNDIDWFRVYAGAFLARESFYKQLCFTNETSLPCALFHVFLVICCDVQGHYLRWPTTFTAKEITSRQKGKDSQQKEKPHGKREKTHRKRKHLTANEKPHGKREKTHSKRKNLTAKEKRLTAKESTSLQTKNLTAKRKRLTAKEKTSRWGYSFCPEVILFAVRFFLCPWVVFFFPWGFSFAVSRFLFAVGFFLWPWVFSFLLRGSSFCREVISLAVRLFLWPWGYFFGVTVVGHRTYWFGKI